MNDVRARNVVCCYRGKVGTNLGVSVGGVLICLCFHVVADVSIASMANWPARPRTQHDYHHDTKVKPEAATAVIELLMMGGKTPETC
jgi:hypothetical protein